MKTIKTEQYWLGCIKGDDQVFEIGSFKYDHILNKPLVITQTCVPPYKGTVSQKVIAHLPIGSAPKLEGVPLLMGEPSDKIANQEAQKEYGENSATERYKGFIEGYKSAQQKGCFTLEQMRKAIEMAKNSVGVDNDGETCYSNLSNDQIIQSLPPEWEYEVEMTEPEGWGKHLVEHSGEPRELHVKPKTTVIDNETYIVGKWKEVNK